MKDYQKLVEGFMNPETLSSKRTRMYNALFGLAGEVGECCDLWKKHAFHAQEFNKEKFKLELGDVHFYLAEACSSIDTTLEEIQMLNVAKLSARYPNGFNTEDSKAKRDEVVVRTNECDSPETTTITT